MFRLVTQEGTSQLTPLADSEKSTTQKATDTVSGGSSDAKDQGSSILGQAQEGLSSTVKSVQDSLGMGESAYFSLPLSAPSHVLTVSAEK